MRRQRRIRFLAILLTVGMALGTTLGAAAEDKKSEEGGQGQAGPAPFGPLAGPFGYWDQMEWQTMEAMRRQHEALRKAWQKRREAERKALESEEAWMDPQARAMEKWMEQRRQALKRADEAWYRWSDPWGAALRDWNRAREQQLEKMMKEREKALEQGGYDWPWAPPIPY